MPFVSSDPDAWMRPDDEAVASRDGFALLPIPIQFATLVNAIAQDHHAKPKLGRPAHADLRPWFRVGATAAW